jgi:hypothetical protein
MLEAIGEQELRLTLARLWTPVVTDLDPEKGNVFTSLEGTPFIVSLLNSIFYLSPSYSRSGIHFLPVDKHVYLRIQSFINLIENTFDCIAHSSFLYKNFLVWSGLEQDDMLKIYKFLV